MIISYKHGNLVLSKLLTIINGLRKYMAPEKTSIRHKQSFFTGLDNKKYENRKLNLVHDMGEGMQHGVCIME